jgi:hypothetical protein
LFVCCCRFVYLGGEREGARESWEVMCACSIGALLSYHHVTGYRNEALESKRCSFGVGERALAFSWNLSLRGDSLGLDRRGVTIVYRG